MLEEGSGEKVSAASQPDNEKESPTMGAIALVVGLIGFGAVIAAVIVFAVTRSRHNSGNGGFTSGTYPQNMGYPPQQPMYSPAQQSYPSGLNQGYPTPSGQSPQQPNPYIQ